MSRPGWMVAVTLGQGFLFSPTVCPHLDYKLLNDPAGLSEDQAGVLLSVAEGLRNATPAAAMASMLRGSNIAVISDDLEAENAMLFERAAVGLGARVARIRSADVSVATEGALQATAKMLGRLYDAVECLGMDAQVVAQLQAHAGIVVYNALASFKRQVFARLPCPADHELMSCDVAYREALIQAVLLGTLR